MNEPIKPWRKLGPGVVVDATGAIHFSVGDMLRHLNTADTPENRAQLQKIICEQLREQWPAASIIETE